MTRPRSEIDLDLQLLRELADRLVRFGVPLPQSSDHVCAMHDRLLAIADRLEALETECLARASVSGADVEDSAATAALTSGRVASAAGRP